MYNFWCDFIVSDSGQQILYQINNIAINQLVFSSLFMGDNTITQSGSYIQSMIQTCASTNKHVDVH